MNSSNELFSPSEMLNPFDTIKESDAERREWWNSRRLARLMGYKQYCNFERLMDKVISQSLIGQLKLTGNQLDVIWQSLIAKSVATDNQMVEIGQAPIVQSDTSLMVPAEN